VTQSGDETFGDEAGEMANETEVEAPVQQGASASAGHHQPVANEPGPADTSGIGHMVDEGAPLEPADIAAANPEESNPEDANPLEEAHVKIAGLTNDLQRLQAEFLNYKRRVDRERDRVREDTIFATLTPIVDVLDNIDRAREHGELDPGFEAVAQQLQTAVAGRGLIRYGEVGEAFDPTVHDALSHLGADPDVSVTSIKVLAKAGYKIGDRVVRAAQVLVVDPE
jgi:molecular chaperone GrpE